MIHYQYQNSKILFIGINPHEGSFRREVPFSNNKMFWYLLNQAGLIQEKMEDLRNDEKLKEIYKNRFNSVYQLGLVNVVDRPSNNATLLKKGEEVPGVKNITYIIHEHKPPVVCFVGKVTYQKFSGLKDVSFGWQPNIDESKIYVMHFPIRGEAAIRIDELREIASYAFAPRE
jgi:double-stranded uracil-DNA glycosylase